jgi:hypothetical protein
VEGRTLLLKANSIRTKTPVHVGIAALYPYSPPDRYIPVAYGMYKTGRLYLVSTIMDPVIPFDDADKRYICFSASVLIHRSLRFLMLYDGIHKLKTGSNNYLLPIQMSLFAESNS